MSIYKVYVIVNKINGKMYVGCTERPLEIRLAKHLGKVTEGSNNSLSKAIRKYGKENFEIRMIEQYSSKETMFQGECDWIAYFDTYKSRYGYNDTPGGEGGDTNGGKKFANEWVVNISKSLTGKPQKLKRRFSEETEKEICRLYSEEENSMYSLAKRFDCQRSTIADLLRRNNIGVRQSNYTGHVNNCNIFSLEQELEICAVFLEKNLSRSQLSRMYNCGKTTIRDILLRHNIKF